MQRFLDCHNCSQLVRSGERACPFCGTRFERCAAHGVGAGLFVVGLVSVGCVVDKETPTSQGDTTVAGDTDSGTETDTDTDSDTDAVTTGGSSSTGGSSTSSGETTMAPTTSSSTTSESETTIATIGESTTNDTFGESTFDDSNAEGGTYAGPDEDDHTDKL